MNIDKVILAIGNPEEKFNLTRHNIGFMVLDHLIKDLNITDIYNHYDFKCHASYKNINDKSVMLVKPTTYVNGTGKCVKSIFKHYKLHPQRILVISDDIHLPVGKPRLRYYGSDGGHNGLKSIINEITDQFPRLKIGIGKNFLPGEQLEFVIQKFSDDELEIFNNRYNEYIEIIKNWINS